MVAFKSCYLAEIFQVSRKSVVDLNLPIVEYAKSVHRDFPDHV